MQGVLVPGGLYVGGMLLKRNAGLAASAQTRRTSLPISCASYFLQLTRGRPGPIASAHNVTHNAGSQLSRNSPNSRRSPLDVVFGKVHKYNILWLTSLTNEYEFHLYYDILAIEVHL